MPSLILTEQFRDARSVFRLSKSIFEVKRIKLIAEKTNDLFGKVVNIISRAFYMVFWLLDNIYIVMKMLKVSTGEQRLLVKTVSRRFQIVGQLLFLIYCVKTLRRTYTDESDLKVAALNKMTVKYFCESLEVIYRLRRDYLLNIVRAFCDFVICVNENQIPKRLFGIGLNEGVQGVLGMASAGVYLFGLSHMKRRA